MELAVAVSVAVVPDVSLEVLLTALFDALFEASLDGTVGGTEPKKRVFASGIFFGAQRSNTIRSYFESAAALA